MPSDGLADPASFRDPSGHVYLVDGRIFRTVTEQAAEDFEFVRASGLLEELSASGRAVATDIVENDGPQELRRGARYLLEHPRLPFISYPYEWCFRALKAAALLHLDVHLAALKRGVTLSDASAYNVQFVGAKPVFIDILSFRRYQKGEYWTGHRQFCEQFLVPLLLRALFGTPHNQWYRGALEGISVSDFTRLLSLRQKLSWNVLSNLVLPSRFEASARRGNIEVDQSTLQKAKLPQPAFEGLLLRLRGWIERLEPKDKTPTTWQNYSLENTYSPEEVAAKRDFIRSFIAGQKPAMVWDFGCNAGDYTAAALSAGAEYVVGWDIDQGALDAAFVRAGSQDLAFTPLFFDAANPAPDQGWAQEERKGMTGRGPADAILALAFTHHLAIARNLPLPRIARWLTEQGRSGVVEFTPKDDETVQTMLRLRADIFEDYSLERFIECLGAHARIERRETINGRELIWYRT